MDIGDIENKGISEMDLGGFNQHIEVILKN